MSAPSDFSNTIFEKSKLSFVILLKKMSLYDMIIKSWKYKNRKYDVASKRLINIGLLYRRGKAYGSIIQRTLEAVD